MERTLSIISEREVLGKDFKVYGDFENPLFLAKDVAEWIDYAYKDSEQKRRNVGMMLQSVDEDEKIKHICEVNNIALSSKARNTQEMWFLTESGLYEVLMLSRKPIAKEFKKEVKKILHELRTKGSYSVPHSFAEALRLAAEQQEKIEQQQTLLLEQKPKVEFYDTVGNSEGLKSVEEVGAMLGYGRIKFFQLLRNMGIFKYVTRIVEDRPKNINLPFREYIERGYFEVKEEPFKVNGTTYNNSRIFVTGKGLQWLESRLK